MSRITLTLARANIPLRIEIVRVSAHRSSDTCGLSSVGGLQKKQMLVSNAAEAHKDAYTLKVKVNVSKLITENTKIQD